LVGTQSDILSHFKIYAYVDYIIKYTIIPGTTNKNLEQLEQKKNNNDLQHYERNKKMINDVKYLVIYIKFLCIKREQQYKYDIGVLNLFEKLRNKIAIHVKIGVQYIKLDMVLCILKKKNKNARS
jgi:hypothetical protein